MHRVRKTAVHNPRGPSHAAGRLQRIGDRDAAHGAFTVAFHGGKGGAGATTLAAETAACAASCGRSVAAFDLDVQRGDLGLRLDARRGPGSHSLADLIPVIDEMDERVLESALSISPCGVRILGAPTGPGEASGVRGEHVAGVLGSAAGLFDLSIIDTAPYFDEVSEAAFGQSDLLVLVVTPELSCLTGARAALDLITAAGVPGERITLVVNRSMPRSDLVTVAEIESLTGVAVGLVLPEDAARCRRFADEGRLLSSGRGALSKGLSAFARLVICRARA